MFAGDEPSIDTFRPLGGDRRQYARINNLPLMANVNGTLVDVLDISLSGLRVTSNPDWDMSAGSVIEIILIPRQNRTLDINHSLRVRGHVIRADQRSVALSFERHSFALSKMIIAAMSQRTGVEPFLVR